MIEGNCDDAPASLARWRAQLRAWPDSFDGTNPAWYLTAKKLSLDRQQTGRRCYARQPGSRHPAPSWAQLIAELPIRGARSTVIVSDQCTAALAGSIAAPLNSIL